MERRGGQVTSTWQQRRHVNHLATNHLPAIILFHTTLLHNNGDADHGDYQARQRCVVIVLSLHCSVVSTGACGLRVRCQSATSAMSACSSFLPTKEVVVHQIANDCYHKMYCNPPVANASREHSLPRMQCMRAGGSVGQGMLFGVLGLWMDKFPQAMSAAEGIIKRRINGILPSAILPFVSTFVAPRFDHVSRKLLAAPPPINATRKAIAEKSPPFAVLVQGVSYSYRSHSRAITNLHGLVNSTTSYATALIDSPSHHKTMLPSSFALAFACPHIASPVQQ